MPYSYPQWRKNSLIREENSSTGELVEVSYEVMKACEATGPSGLPVCTTISLGLSHFERFMATTARGQNVVNAVDRCRMDVRCRVCNRLQSRWLPFRSMSQIVLLWRSLAVSMPAGTSTSLLLETVSRPDSNSGHQTSMESLIS